MDKNLLFDTVIKVDFGSNTPVQASGYVKRVGYVVDALVRAGSYQSDVLVLEDFVGVSDGSISVKTGNGLIEDFTGLDFTGATTGDEVVNVFVAESPTNFSFVNDNGTLVAVANTSGEDVVISFLGVGTDLTGSDYLDVRSTDYTPAKTRGITECYTADDVAKVTANTDMLKAFDYGLTPVYIVAVDSADDLGAVLKENPKIIMTAMMTSDIATTEYANINMGGTRVVPVIVNKDKAKLEDHIGTMVCYLGDFDNAIKSFNYIFTGATIGDGQFQELDNDDEIGTVAEADILFEQGYSYGLEEQKSYYLASFQFKRKPIRKVYVEELISISMQNAGVSYIQKNQPKVNDVEAKALSFFLYDECITPREENGEIDEGSVLTITPSTEDDTFSMVGQLTLSQFTALWRLSIEVNEEA